MTENGEKLMGWTSTSWVGRGLDENLTEKSKFAKNNDDLSSVLLGKS